MNRFRRRQITLAMLALTIGLGAAPAPPSYHSVQRAVDGVRAVWTEKEPGSEPNVPGWESFLQGMMGELEAYSRATDSASRAAALDRLLPYEAGLASVGWMPAVAVRTELANWLRPRRQIAEADRQFRALLAGIPDQAGDTNRSHRDGWVRFVEEDLGGAIREYERASTVTARQDALRKLRSSLLSMIRTNSQRPWAPALTLQEAVRTAYSHNNLDITADANSLSPFLAQQVVQNEMIFRNGYWSTVYAGAYTGFGLMDSDNGIAFYNKQLASTATPITDFQQQVASDRRGRLAAKMYQFAATSYNNPEVTVIAIITTAGLVLQPGSSHNVTATFSSAPAPGGGLGRAVTKLIGLGPQKITNQVAQGAIGQIQQGVIEGASQEAQERSAAQAGSLNAQFRQYLVGNNTLLVNPLAVVNLSLRSRNQFALVEGTATWNDLVGEALGADAPQPPALQVLNTGVAADVHIGSILSAMARGFLETGPGRDVRNVLIVTKDLPEGTPLSERVAVLPNATGEALLQAAQTRKPNNPKEQVARVFKPTRAPEFAADANGNLVALLHDFQVDVPAPGGQLYRVQSPLVEVLVSFGVQTDLSNGSAVFTGKLVDLNFGARATVSQLGADGETVAQRIALGGVFLNLIRAGARNRPIELPLPTQNLRGFALASVSPLDPSGWMRVILTPRR